MGVCERVFLVTLSILLGATSVTFCATLRYYNGSLDDYTTISLDNPTVLLNASGFSMDKNTTIYTFGFKGGSNLSEVQEIIGAYLKLNEVNIVLLNWENEDSIDELGIASYPLIVLNVKKIGEELGKAIIKLVEAGLNLPGLHLIGFSLGAHIMGYAGREVKKKGYTIPRITGLDPAGPLYEGGIGFLGLDATTASFVDVVHANPGFFGTYKSVGTVDIWPNCESRIQPGCESNSVIIQPTRELCSHFRVWEYFSEALLRPQAFQARRAVSCDEWKQGKGTGEIVYIGNKINLLATGNFYLRTNSKPLYGLGELGSQPAEVAK